MSLSWLPLLLATEFGNPSKAKGVRRNAKPGPKRQQPGKGVTAAQLVGRNKLEALAWKKKCSLLVLLAGRQGQAYEYGAVPMALRVLLNLVDEAVPRTGTHTPGMPYEEPSVESPAWALHRDGKGKAPTTDARGTVYDCSSKATVSGPTSKEPAAATTK
jgi:hypothetical protein